jgi:methylase of polypeptide subunit release factors
MRPVLVALLIASTAAAQDAPSFVRHVRLLLEREGNKAATDQDLRKELLSRRDEEQRLRLKAIDDAKKGTVAADLEKRLEDVDRANREWLKGIVEKKGWPGQTLVGFDGADAAWLLVQHADPDPAFQKTALRLLEEAVKRKDARPTHLAYLTDRVLTGEGKKQLYGTQFTMKDGRLEPRPIQDEVNVDKRRAEVGLPPLAEYRKQMEKAYGK